jgi:hypothetical protein
VIEAVALTAIMLDERIILYQGVENGRKNTEPLVDIAQFNA